MAEYPPISRIHVVGYSANDNDFPILNQILDPRVAGYKVPEDLSACPDKRYPNHVFTGAQPISGDQRVRHIWEILPSPWVPFTRYDDDLGPIQGRRRSVKNEGQVASLAADKRVTYEARDGSAIVYTELEEAWSTATDEDGNSLFPVRDRDFYDASRGPVQERRQLFVPTGEEEGRLENINGIITQTSYEPYNEFLSFKVVQTYRVDGPQLIGQSTNNSGQLATVTTQRKAADGYVAPNPTAKKTVEVSREDAESLVERIVDIPNVFDSLTKTAQKPDTVPEKFRVNAPTKRTEEVVESTNAEDPILASDEYLKTEQRVTEFTVQKTTVEREDNLNEVQNARLEENWGIQIPYKEYVSDSIPDGDAFEAEGISDTQHVVREYDKETLEETLSSFSIKIPTSIDLDLPRILKNVTLAWQEEQSQAINETDTTGSQGEFTSVTQQDDGLISSTLSLIPKIDVEFEDIWGKNIPATSHIFFLKKEQLTDIDIRDKVGASENWPTFKPVSFSTTIFGKTEKKQIQAYISRALQANDTDIGYGYLPSKGSRTESSISLNPVFVNIPPCLTEQRKINQTKPLTFDGSTIVLSYAGAQLNVNGSTINLPPVNINQTLSHSISCTVNFTIPESKGQTDVPRSGVYVISSSAEPYKFGWFLVKAITFDASILA